MRRLPLLLFLLLLAGFGLSFFCAPPSAHAGETIVWDGTTSPPAAPTGTLTPTASSSDNTLTVILPAGAVTMTVGGAAAAVNGSGNTVTITGQGVGVSFLNGNVWAGNGLELSNSHLTLEGISYTGTPRVLNNKDGTISNSTLTVINSHIGNELRMADGGPADNNLMTVIGSTVTGHLCLINASNAVTNNRLVVKNSQIVDGSAGHGTYAENNHVEIEDSEVTGTLYGAGGGTDMSRGNSVTLRGTTSIIGDVRGNQGNGASQGNWVTLEGSDVSVTGTVTGGSSATFAVGNRVDMQGGTVGAIQGALATGMGSASANNVSVRGGEVRGTVTGALAYKGNATGNHVDISGGTTGTEVYGAYVQTEGDATDNTVTVRDNPNLSGTSIYGGFSALGDDFTGNTLNFLSKGLRAVNLGNFENYNFIMPAGTQSGDTMLTLTGAARTDMSNAKVAVGLVAGGPPLAPGAVINLVVNNTGGIKADGLTGELIRGQHGLTVEYEFKVRATPTAVQAYLENAQVNPGSKPLSEGMGAVLALVNKGSDLALRGALANHRRTENPWGLNVFAIMNGGSSRHDTGSHVDLTGTNMAAGVTNTLRVEGGRVLLGLFVEAGFARYKTYNGFSDRPSITGGGTGRYYGGGVLAHYSRMRKGADGVERPRGFYAEASARAGGMEMDFASGDLRDALGRKASYTAASPYMGAHVGVGHVWELGPKTTLDAYTQLHWTQIRSNDYKVLDEKIYTDNMNSWRWRTGVRLGHAWSEQVKGRVGVAYEHAFDGEVRARANGMELPRPGIQGSSALGEAGLTIRPGGEGGGFSADVSVQGSVGQQQGIGGEVMLMYEF